MVTVRISNIRLLPKKIPAITAKAMGFCLLLRPLNIVIFTLTLQKSRMSQVRGVKGTSRSKLLRTLDNKGDGVLSTFPEGKQHGEKATIIGNNRELSLDQGL